MTIIKTKKVHLAVVCSYLISGSAAGSNILEEVIVKAQKRDQSLQDVGLTITAFDSKNITDQGLDSAYQLADAVPNLQAFDNAAGQTHFRIRGLGLNEFQVSFDSPVAINIDEVILSKPFMASMGAFDIQRIEVLKGPQGTVFGRNTTGGAVNYYTNEPTEEFEAGIRGGYANYDRSELDGYISGPLTKNLSGRLAFSGAYAGGNEGPYTNVYNNKKIGSKNDKRQIRAKIAWSNDITRIQAAAHYGVQKGEITPYDNLFQDIPGSAFAGGTTDITKEIRDPVGRFTINSDHHPVRDNSAEGISLRLDHDFDWATFTSLTAYEYFERDQREDSDNTPVASTNIDWYSEIVQLSQEFRLSGERDKLNYLLGFYYENDDLSEIDTINLSFLESIGAVAFKTAGANYQQETDTWALFANIEYDLSDQVQLIVGARYTEEKNDYEGLSFVASGLPGDEPTNAVDPATYLAGTPVNQSRKDTDFNVKLGINYYPAEDILLFSSYSTGFRSGGFDVGLVAEPLIVFEPESVSAFEAGMKTTLLEGSLNLNLSLFFTEVENYQENANLPTELTPRRRNVGTMETKGAEFDLTWRPDAHWLIRGALGYSDAEIVQSDFLIGDIPIEGNTPANSPEFSSSVQLSYLIPLGDDLEVELMSSWTWVDERYLEVENQADHLVSAYNKIDARIQLSSIEGNWQVSAWVKNLENEIHTTYINDVPGFGLFLPINSEPRTFGVNFEYKL